MAISNFSTFVDIEKLQNLQNSFANSTNLALVLVDANDKQITKPSNPSDVSASSQKLNDKKIKADKADFVENVLFENETVAKVIVEPVKEDVDSSLDNTKLESIKSSTKLFADIAGLFISSEYYVKHNDKRVSILETEVKNVLEDTNAISTHTEELRHISKRQNILALNASIEAGRAGEAGKGFSVVADQMAVLSKQSSDIYSSITTFAKNIDTSIHKLDNFFNDSFEDDNLMV